MPDPIDIGQDRQLFLDPTWIEYADGVERRLHEPVRRERVIVAEHPWEAEGISYLVAWEEEGTFRAWYRVGPKGATAVPPASGEPARDATPASQADHPAPAADPATPPSAPRPERRPDMTWDELAAQGGTPGMCAYAESDDGVHWAKPELGLIDLPEGQGSRQRANNLVWHATGNNLCPFLDPSPGVPAAERYKAIMRHHTVFGLVSPDGLRWRLLRPEPLLTDPPFDSHNIAFFDERLGEYVIYSRGVLPGVPAGARTDGSTGGGPFRGGLRWVRRWRSPDFRTWSGGELIDCGDAPAEQFYTNACIPYDRAPGAYLMFPSRFVQEREPIPGWPHGPGVSDIVFLSSRDGLRFDRSFMEAFVRPGPDPGNWHERGIYMERALLHTGPAEISLYGMENWRLPSVAIRRYTLRTDGFVSIRAGYRGGTFTTPPFTFAGHELELNYATSAVGHVRAELQDEHGTPLPGLSLADSQELFGDEVAGTISWTAAPRLAAHAGRGVRLRFAVRDADLYAFRFR